MSAPTPAQAQKTAAQWNATDKDAFTLELYHAMFRMHPEWRPLFKNMPAGDVDYTNPTWKNQIDVTRDALDGAINKCATDQQELLQGLRSLAERHKPRKVGQPEFQKMKVVLAEVAKKRVSNIDRDSWMPVVHFILDNIKTD